MKVFCIGRNKTGTTSFQKWMNNVKLNVCPQPLGEEALAKWGQGDFSDLVKYSEKYQGFQDLCWNLDGVPQLMYSLYPDAYFVLTVRESEDVWYDSLIRYMNKTKPKTMAGLGRTKRHKLIYGCEIENAEQTKNHYLKYNQTMIDFFTEKQANFMVLEIPSDNIPERLSQFTGLPIAHFPHANKSR